MGEGKEIEVSVECSAKLIPIRWLFQYYLQQNCSHRFCHKIDLLLIIDSPHKHLCGREPYQNVQVGALLRIAVISRDLYLISKGGGVR